MNFRIRTLGDVLRDFKKCVDIIYTDVLLLLSDTVPIANIQDIIKAHFVNKEKCKNQIMTVMLSYNLNENRPYNDQFVVAYDVLTFKLLLYESLKNKKYLTITDSLLDNINSSKGRKGKQKCEKSAYARTNSEYTTGSSDCVTGSSDNIVSISNESISNEQILNHQGDICSNIMNINHIDNNYIRYKSRSDSTLDTSTNALLFFYDSVIPNIFIITPQVFKLFEQNFDYQCMHKDFIYNILNQEIKIEEIYVYELNNDYNYTECNQIIITLSDFRMYFNFYKTILERHIHPFISKASYLLPDLPKLVYTDPGIYKAKNVTIDETCKLLKLVSIDKYTYILANTIIENSIICKNCKIGKNVKIYNSIIGKNTIIKNNVTILGSYISENNIINDNVFINECCVIGRNTNIPANMEIHEYTRLSVYQYLKDKMTSNQKHKQYGDGVVNFNQVKKGITTDSTNNAENNETNNAKSNEKTNNTSTDVTTDETTTTTTITNIKESTSQHKKNEQYENEHIVIIDPAELNKYIIKMKYSKDELRLFSLVGNIDNYEKKQNKNLLTYDSFDESDQDSTGYVSTSDSTSSEMDTCNKNVSHLGGSDLGGSDLGGSDLGGSDLGGSDLGGSDLGGSHLGGSHLGGSDLGGSDISSTKLGNNNIKREADNSIITNTIDDTTANKSKDLSVILNHIDTEFDKKNIESDKYIFNNEISLLCKEAIEKPEFMSHKILEMKSFRLSLNYKDIDVLISFFPVIWNGINGIEFEKDTWVSYFDKNKIDLLFSSFLIEDQLYYETIYDLILQYSKQKFLENNVINNLYGPDKLCNIFEFLYHSDIFEFNYFKE
uniref:W2 domain-containing protein n=1 Tax=Piliocolobus tephrosceles TaxID=591936 RepID=A0A8C9GE69_9PRIM